MVTNQRGSSFHLKRITEKVKTVKQFENMTLEKTGILYAKKMHAKL